MQLPNHIDRPVRERWTIAYRRPRGRTIHRCVDWRGTWEQARDMATRCEAAQPGEYEIWYVPTLAEDIRGACASIALMHDVCNLLIDGRRVPMTETGTISTFGPWEN